MKNVTEQRPDAPLAGRTAFSVRWVDPADITAKELLDVGCGYGWFEHHALKHAPQKIVGTELAQRDLDTVLGYFDDRRTQFCVGSAIDLPFSDGSFDTVVSWEVIEHIPKGTENEMFAEIRRVLRKGGHFYLSTPHSTPLCNATDPAWWLIGHRHYTLGQIEELGSNYGFRAKQLFVKGGYWTIAAMLDMYASKWLLRRSPLLTAITQPRENAEFADGASGFANVFAKFEAV